MSPRGIRDRLGRWAAQDEELRHRAESEIMALLPSLSRTAKRLLNRLYFLLVVCYSRDLLGQGKVTPEQIGKWAVLLDRWPEAARAIVRDPALVRRLEASADDAVTFDRLCTDHQPALAGELPPLRDFSHATPKLAEAAKSLVHLESSSE